MLTLHLLILSFLQGATEFLPISSSGHLAALPLIMDWPDQGLLIDVSVHLGTLLAVMIYFRREVAAILRGGLSYAGAARKNPAERKLFLALALATVPVVVAGGLLVLAGWEVLFRSTAVIGTASIGFGLLLYWADQKGARAKRLEGLALKPALLIGLAQILALIPGTSRAGITMTAGRALGFERTEAARFSMLLSIPTILAAGGWSSYQLIRTGGDAQIQAALFSAAVAFVTAIAAIHFLMRWLERASMTIFVVYRVVFGLALLVLAG